MTVTTQRDSLLEIAQMLRDARSVEQKCKIVQKHLPTHVRAGFCPTIEGEYIVSVFRLIEQDHLIGKRPPTQQQIDTLLAIDHLYESLGGLVGYHLKVLQLLEEQQQEQIELIPAVPIDITEPDEELIASGLAALPYTGEIYPIGGLGSRLNIDAPAALLPFCGRTLLEGLVRDVEGREALYRRTFGKKVTVPIALMTSQEKNNHRLIEQLCEDNAWFGRPKESFCLFSQLSVPVIDQQGKWVMEGPYAPHVQPGGHGALWRTAEQQGVFAWFRSRGKSRLLIRQINNPISGLDHGLLSLVGAGIKHKKALGFASCPRRVGAAEGMLAIKEQGGKRTLSNVEYTEFKRLEIKDEGHSANTNIIYVDLEQMQPVIETRPLPGLMLNMKQKRGESVCGRLESMMQNISDIVPAARAFLTHNSRRRTISATKRAYKGQELLETPEGAFYDVLCNAHELLQLCGFAVDPFGSAEEYLKTGPSHLFLYHPALGPTYHEIAKKLRGGTFSKGSELQLEIEDFACENLTLEGSLRVIGLGGKCRLKNVTVRNRGIDRRAPNCYWKNQIEREALTIIIEPGAEFVAEDVVFSGGKTLTIR